MCADRVRRPCRVLVSMAKKQKAAAGIRKPLEALALAGLCAAFAGTPVLSRAVSPVPVYAESRDAGGETGKTKAGIAVVNLDEGVVVDGKPVRYSDQIVSLPETGDYTFATLAEAQTGIDTGRFGGYVLIPAGFSRTVVSINSQPDPCEVQYFINKALDKEEVYASLQAVHAFKDRLSDSMSYMYVNNILEEFHTAQDSAETVLENDRTDLASANAVQSEGILSAVTFSEMAVPADTTTPLNAAAYITRNAEILSSIAEDYSAKDSETASRMSAMQQAGAGLSETLASLGKKPAMVITDSQAFGKVKDIVPDYIPLTSFSILMARYKGFLETAVKGAAAIENLDDGDTVLISEGCTHHRQCDDIGTVKLPRWLKAHTGKDIIIETTSGKGYPEDLSPYKLIIHCGGCMLNEREMTYRRKSAEDSGVPFTNYGTAIAYLNGILKRTLSVFPDLQKLV